MTSNDHASKIIMQGIHVELTPALQRAILEKFDAILRHNERIIRLHVRLHKDQKLGNEYHYTATAQAEIGGPDLVAHDEDKDAYVVLDKVSQTLDTLLEKRHERRKEKRNHPHAVEIDAEIPKVTRAN
jgi:putative sigma-54 modulation protein